MAKKKVQLNISGEDLKYKLNIKDGYSPIKGVDYFDGEKGDRGDTPDTTEVAVIASKMAQVELEKQIPTITQIAEELPIQPEKYRDGLELLQDDERLDKKAIRGLDDYDEISKLAREPRKTINKNYASSGTALQTLQQVTDNGSTTTNSIVSTNAPTFTYSGDFLTNITYSNTLEKDITYNGDGTIDELIITMPDSTVITKTFVWSSGVLQSIIIT